mmetsp:Transcript_13632/g.19268  ORF Transcript_13632/g.19268 Transcript_13632/m.19268 type:complete len:282 (+) Transcript_13632:76-921(+)
MEKENATVFVGNLSWDTNEDDLSDFMSKAGTVKSCLVKRHPDSSRSKGWGLVEFSKKEEAEKAIKLLNGTSLDDRILSIRMDRTSIENSGKFALYVGNLPWSTTSEDLEILFNDYNPIDCYVKTNMAGRSRGVAILRFSDEQEGQKAIIDMNGTDIDGRIILVREDRDIGETTPNYNSSRRNQKNEQRNFDSIESLEENENRKNKVYVGNLSYSTTSSILENAFSMHEGFLSAEVQTGSGGRSKGWGLVHFKQPNQALAAAEQMNQTTIQNRKIFVRLDKK